MDYVFWTLLGIASYVGVPVLFLWGWVRWIVGRHLWDWCSILTFAAFILGTVSVLTAAWSISYAGIRGAPFDPLVTGALVWGPVIALGGPVVSLAGVWRRTLLRWHSLGLCICVLCLWVALSVP